MGILISVQQHEWSVKLIVDLHITEYLDVTLNLKTGKYYPYRKKNTN